MRIEYLAWCSSREVFIAVMTSLTNPVTGTPLATLQEDDSLLPSEGVRIDEIGPARKGETLVGGHHINLWAADRLGSLLDWNGGWWAIFPLLGVMNFVSQNEDGIPEGWQGSSGMRIYPPEHVTHRVRNWA